MPPGCAQGTAAEEEGTEDDAGGAGSVRGAGPCWPARAPGNNEEAGGLPRGCFGGGLLGPRGGGLGGGTPAGGWGPANPIGADEATPYPE